MKKLLYFLRACLKIKALSLLIFSFSTLNAQLKVSKVFSDHAVLQRGLELPVWGTAAPDANISIDFDTIKTNTQADSRGKWKVVLPAQKAGGPYALTIKTDSEKIEFKDILIGDVWLCSGQSNMEWIVANSNDATAEIAGANDDYIRHFKVARSHAFLPQDTLAGGQWEVCTPVATGNFTAVGYYFAKELRKHQNIPIGLLNASWGGSRIEPWMSAESSGFSTPAESSVKVTAKMDSVRMNTISELEKRIGKLPKKDHGIKGDFPIWASTDYNDNNWKVMALPGNWESKGYPHLDGVVWFRKEIYLTKEEAENEISIHLGPIDDSDITYWNGKVVGKINDYQANRIYNIPAAILKTGVNVLAVRVIDTDWGGGFAGKCEDLFYASTSGKKSLCGDWHFKIGKVDLINAAKPIDFPTLLYHQMIHPILNFPIKGALWYQGESNAGREEAKKYQSQFPALIQDWRKQWNCGAFPFLWVQLANWQKTEAQPTDPGWARLREAQNKTLKTPNTAQAVIIDIGDAEDIHPRNKQDVGLRLSLAARKLAYGEDVVYSGPVYQSMAIKNDKIRLNFELFNSPMISKNDEALQTFEIAGNDKKFYWANAKIEGNQIVVWSDKVSNPVAVRYAWANNPVKANLYNAAGIPASPFRTDNW